MNGYKTKFNMNARLDRTRVKGFLNVDGTRTRNGDGEEIILSGVGLGNWLLPEGYMWGFGGGFDRPRRIEALIAYLTGETYAAEFWKRFRAAYITRRDFEIAAEMGFNSIRIPFNARLLLAEEPGIHFLDDGFSLIDRCLEWCEDCSLYAILDLHGAPGGQTGWNIDDSFDDIPRLFIDAESRARAIALWEEIARRYRDRWIVAAYDLLNEPLRTSRPGKPDTEHLHSELIRFYEDCIAAIRRIDDRHALSIEGANWASRTDTFTHRFDPRMIIHFHRYGTLPGEEGYAEWLALSKRLNAPIWLGESGENDIEWYGAMYPLAIRLGFGYNFWAWKKIARKPSLLEIPPETLAPLVDFTRGGSQPPYTVARKICDAYLDAIQADACIRRDDVADAILRRGCVTLMATDFDSGPEGCSGGRPKGNSFNYRGVSGMQIKPRRGETYEHGPGFDCGWKKLCLELRAGEWAAYSLHDVNAEIAVTLTGETTEPTTLRLSLMDDSSARDIEVSGLFTATCPAPLAATGDTGVRITCIAGCVDLHSVRLES